MRIRFYEIFLILLIFIKFSCSESKISINDNSSEEVEDVLNILYYISGKSTLTGHHNFKNDPTEFHNEVMSITGDFPIVWGSDFDLGFKIFAQSDRVR